MQKKFQTVMTALSHMNEGLGLRINDDEEAWIETMTSEETCMVGDVFEGGTTELDLDDLEGMDPDMIRDAVDAGMALSSVDAILEEAKHKKQEALEMKQLGNIEGAKAALLEFKNLQSKAEQVKKLLKSMQNEDDDEEFNLDDLVQSLETDTNGDDEKKTNQKEAEAAPAVVATTKSAVELKEEVLQLESEKKIKEATETLKLYKLVLQKENNAKEKKKIKKTVQSIEKEISVAKEQRQLFKFYERFVDSNDGKNQIDLWGKYSSQCIHAAKLIQTNGLDACIVSQTTKQNNNNMQLIECNVMEILEEGIESDDERMEVSIVSVKMIEENKYYIKELKRQEMELKANRRDSSNSNDSKKTKESAANNSNSNTSNDHPPTKLRVEVTIQLPISEENTDDIQLVFVPTLTVKERDESYEFEFAYSQHANLPRGKSKHAKMIVRRLSRKRIVISVFQHFPPKKPKGWFSSKSSDDNKDIQPLFLGKIIIDLKEFWNNNCVAGDFPLMDSGGFKTVGGQISLGIRTGVPFDPDLMVDDDDDQEKIPSKPSTIISPYTCMSFASQEDYFFVN